MLGKVIPKNLEVSYSLQAACVTDSSESLAHTHNSMSIWLVYYLCVSFSTSFISRHNGEDDIIFSLLWILYCLQFHSNESIYKNDSLYQTIMFILYFIFCAGCIWIWIWGENNISKGSKKKLWITFKEIELYETSKKPDLNEVREWWHGDPYLVFHIETE